ncbi:MAG TPA: FkbM family methyltransferase [Thermoleophilaceae bacterium]|nr:FkbM family methyltransferase [Thermoleophilaceae bacterium]
MSRGDLWRTRAVRFAASSERRRNPLAGAFAAPARAWLRRGAVRVPAGAAAGLRLSLEHLPVTHAHAAGIASGWVEHEVQEAMRRHLAGGGVVYDVGANIGFFALLAARLVGPAGHVYAVEPVAENADAVRANAELNDFENVTVVERAAGATTGREPLLVVADASWSHLAARGSHPQTARTVEVEVVALDELVAAGEIAPPTFVKIDVEGSEADVLNGMRESLRQHRPIIVCELHDTNAEVADALEELGYEVTSLEGPQPLREAPPDVHVIARPR